MAWFRIGQAGAAAAVALALLAVPGLARVPDGLKLEYRVLRDGLNIVYFLR